MQCDRSGRWLRNRKKTQKVPTSLIWTTVKCNQQSIGTSLFYLPLIKIVLFVWGISSNSRIFHSFGYVIIAGKGFRILTYTRHLWSLSSEGSCACHTYCNTGHPFIMELSRPVFTTKVCRKLSTFRMGVNT